MRRCGRKTPDIAGDSLYIDFGALLERSEGIRGWLVCNGGIVNYPVMQAGDNDYYLRHFFLNREKRTMFGSLKDVLENRFREEEARDLIYLTDTDKCLRIYQIFSCYVAESETFYITISRDRRIDR